MTATIATSEDMVTPEGRQGDRTHLFLVATLYAGGASEAVRVRNLSPTGALIEGLALPPVGTAVVLRRGPLEASGSVVWQRGRHAGLALDGPLAVEAWLPTREAARQEKVDRIAFGVKHGLADGAPPPVVAAARLTSAEIVAELERLRLELGRLGDALAQDAALIAAHPEVQLLDPAAQALGKIAAALRKADR